VNAVSGKVVRYLSIRANMIDGDVPFYVKIWPKLTHPLQKRQVPIIIRSPQRAFENAKRSFSVQNCTVLEERQD